MPQSLVVYFNLNLINFEKRNTCAFTPGAKPAGVNATERANLARKLERLVTPS